MKNKNFYYVIKKGVLILFLFFLSCHSKEKHPDEIKNETVPEVVTPPEAGKVYDRITKSNSSYSLYIPKNFSGTEKYPVIIFIDPHAKGNYPLGKYKGLAEKFQFMMIGCNDSKNGMMIDQSMKFISDLLNEATNILPGKTNEISLAGFSGGAKVALVGGNTINGFSNIIYCGAALSPGSIKMNVPLLAFAGSHDMNYSDVRNFNQSLENQNVSHSFREWNGKHEWPDSSTFVHAFYWNLFTSMRKKAIEKNKIVINDFKKIIESEIIAEKNPLRKSLLLSEEIEMLKDLEAVDAYTNKYKSLINSGTYKDAKQNQDRMLAFEDQRKSEFAGAFENREISWWNNEIQLLNRDKNNESNQRLLGYISLVAWSYSSKAVTMNNSAFARKALQVYKLADPENSEQPFLAACLYSKNGMQDSAIYFLKESIELGLDDRTKIENEKDLFALRGRSDFQELIGRMK